MYLATHQPLTYLFVLFTAVAFWTYGCDGCGDAEVYEPPEWEFASERAPYKLVFPPNWSREPRGAINPNSDIEVHRDETLFFLVIAQELRFPEPNLLQFKQEGLRSLDESIDDFVVRRRGPLELDGVSGMTVFASGDFQGESISYITSYAISDGIGYQLIAFGASEHESKLFEDVDLILSSWQFVSEDGTEDAPTVDAVEQEHDMETTNSLAEPEQQDQEQEENSSP